MNDNRSSTGGIRRVQPDDPRIESCTRWLATATLRPATKKKVFEAIFKALDESEEFTTVEPLDEEDEVRQPSLAEEIQGREIPEEVSPDLWDLWVRHYGQLGARVLAKQAGLIPLE